MFNIFKRKPKIKIGDTVKCIDDRDWNNQTKQTMSLVYGKTYVILDIIKCSSCGNVSYDIGCRFNNSNIYTKCRNKHIIPGQGIHWAGDFRFAKLTSNEQESEVEKQLDKEIKKALKRKVPDLIA